MSWIMIMGKEVSRYSPKEGFLFPFVLFYFIIFNYSILFFSDLLFKGTLLWVKIIFAFYPFSFCSLGPLKQSCLIYFENQQYLKLAFLQLLHLLCYIMAIYIYILHAYIYTHTRAYVFTEKYFLFYGIRTQKLKGLSYHSSTISIYDVEIL